MRTDTPHLKNIRDHCNELSNTFAKLAIDIGELVDDEEGVTNTRERSSAVKSAEEEQIVTAKAAKLQQALSDIGELVHDVEGVSGVRKLSPAGISAKEKLIATAKAVKSQLVQSDTNNKLATAKAVNLQQVLSDTNTQLRLGSPIEDFKVGDIVRVTNRHKSKKYGSLYHKIGKVEDVGKTFIFFRVSSIPDQQQRIAKNLEIIRAEK